MQLNANWASREERNATYSQVVFLDQCGTIFYSNVGKVVNGDK
jgi:hypothetical protein